MNATIQIVKRNMINYFYDKTSIFFSLLSVFLLIIVYVLFLGKIQIDGITQSVGNIEGIHGTVNSWLIAGLIVTSSVTVPMSTMSDIVTDIENKSFQDFLVAPISRKSIVLAYVISSIIIGFLMATLTFVLGFIYLGLTSGIWLSFLSIIAMLGVIFLSVMLFSSLSYVIFSFIKTTSAAGTVNTLVGTLIGFFAGIYVPFGAFNQSFQNILKLNPSAQIVSLMRQILTSPYTEFLFKDAPEAFAIDYKDQYGITLNIFDFTLNGFHITLIGLVWVGIFLAIGFTRLKKFKA